MKVLYPHAVLVAFVFSCLLDSGFFLNSWSLRRVQFRIS